MYRSSERWTASLTREWLEADGHGGFASGTVAGIRTRRYHALLLAAVKPPTGRVVLVNGIEAWIETDEGHFPLTSQWYAPEVIHPDGVAHLEAFAHEPWPHWIFKLGESFRIEHEIFTTTGGPLVHLGWKVLGPHRAAKLFVRPLLSGRDYHALHKANPSFQAAPHVHGARVSWTPYNGLPGIVALSSGVYHHEPLWYYNFLYPEEQHRGLDCTEDLLSPGIFELDLAKGEAALIFDTDQHAAQALPEGIDAIGHWHGTRERERQVRAQFPSALHRAASAYVVRGRMGTTLLAGYPWFTDWGRDTFIALRGICLAAGRIAEAGQILRSWASAVSDGMLPNRFPDHGELPEFNAVDASLWFIVAAHEYLRASKVNGRGKKLLLGAITAILEGYTKGTRYGIRLDEDGLVAAGVPGTQLTWMDAKISDWVVTPRIGKPVEVQALWLNALWIGSQHDPRWKSIFDRGLESFRKKFWNEAGGYLNDVVEVDHIPEKVDATFRPNQILAVGGLPISLIEQERAAAVVALVEARLWVPLGLRSLAREEPHYAGRYTGGVRERDSVYHQGTVWPWLIGPFVEAWVRVRGGTNEAKRDARAKFLAPLLAHLDEAGLGHISEIADGDPPHTPRGCPFQAWSVGEALRLDQVVLAENKSVMEKTRVRKK
jgi:predicted glycogen debranching enzyme